MSDREQLAAILREHSMPSSESDFPADEFECCADAVLAAGWRPSAQVMETVESLHALPDETIVRSCYGTAVQKVDDVWEFPGEVGRYLCESVDLPATVLWRPTEKAGQ